MHHAKQYYRNKNYLSYKQQQETNSNVLKNLYSCRAIQIHKNRGHLIKNLFNIMTPSTSSDKFWGA